MKTFEPKPPLWKKLPEPANEQEDRDRLARSLQAYSNLSARMALDPEEQQFVANGLRNWCARLGVDVPHYLQRWGIENNYDYE